MTHEKRPIMAAREFQISALVVNPNRGLGSFGSSLGACTWTPHRGPANPIRYVFESLRMRLGTYLTQYSKCSWDGSHVPGLVFDVMVQTKVLGTRGDATSIYLLIGYVSHNSHSSTSKQFLWIMLLNSDTPM